MAVGGQGLPAWDIYSICGSLQGRLAFSSLLLILLLLMYSIVFILSVGRKEKKKLFSISF